MTDSNESDFDRELRQLAQEAQQHPVGSLGRQLALTKLISKIYGRLGHPQRGNWQSSLYEDFYNEARQNTVMYICQKIDTYRPEHPVMAWANFILAKQLYKVTREWMRSSSLDPEEIDKIPYENKPADEPSQLLRELVRDDPDGLLQAKTLRERPDVTVQYILLKRLEGEKFTAIAHDLGIPISTLCAFYDRRLKKLKPYFEKHLR